MSDTSTKFRPIPPPGSTVQSLAAAVSALTQVVEQLVGHRGDGSRKAQLQADKESLQSQINTITKRLKAANIP